MDVLASSVEVGRFFATADPTPENVWIMRVRPRPMLGNEGTCENINTGEFWSIAGNRYVRLISEDEYDKTRFDVLTALV